MPGDREFLERLRAIFAQEAEEHLDAFASGLIALEKADTDDARRELLERIFRGMHSLKGAAHAVERDDIAAVCHPLESLLAGLRDSAVPLDPGLLDLLHDASSGLRRIVDGAASPGEVEALSARVEAAVATTGKPRARKKKAVPAEPRLARDMVQPATRRTPADTIRASTAKVDALFRQAEELIAAKLWTGKHGAELRSLAADLAARHDALARAHALLVDAAGSSGEAALNAAANALETEVAHAAAAQQKARFLAQGFEADRRTLSRSVDNLLEDARMLLMQPLSALLESVPRLVRELAREQGKEVDVVVRGEDIELDRRIQENLKDPLIHLVRNAVDHGIETPAAREAAGKPRRATLTITATQTDVGKVSLVIADDGGGIDPERLREAAARQGEDVAGLSEGDLVRLIFRPGLSTSPEVTDVSGRGVGLAIVQEKVEGLGGSIDVSSHKGAGTRFRLLLPVTLASLRGVVVSAVGRSFVIPTAGIERVARVAPGEIRSVENRDTVHLDGHTLPVVRLADLLELEHPPVAAEGRVPLVVLAAGGEHVAVVVDRIEREQEVLLKDLGGRIVRARNVSGVTMLPGGQLAPVLNVSDLVQSSRGVSPSRPAAETEPRPAAATSVLVVEDSITARALLKNILEAAGYKVRTAVDGIDALTTLRVEPVDVVVSDVEMPRMNGFDLTARIRADRALAHIPVILVTALDSRDHRERGIEVGASAYIVKSRFDQAGLLQAIRRLAG